MLIFSIIKCATSRLQLMDQGVIRSLKAMYRVMMVWKIVDAIDKGTSIELNSILEAMKMLVLLWENVSSTTIIQSNRIFKARRRTGFARRLLL